MKLIYCPYCHDIVKLIVSRKRLCLCRKSYGAYCSDGLKAKIGGLAIPLGIANQSFEHALKDRSETGNVSQFTAFVIEKHCENIATG